MSERKRKPSNVRKRKAGGRGKEKKSFFLWRRITALFKFLFGSIIKSFKDCPLYSISFSFLIIIFIWSLINIFFFQVSELPAGVQS